MPAYLSLTKLTKQMVMSNKDAADYTIAVDREFILDELNANFEG